MASTSTESSQSKWEEVPDGTVLQFKGENFCRMKINQSYMVEVIEDDRCRWIAIGQAVLYNTSWDMTSVKTVRIPYEDEAAGMEPGGNFNTTFAAPLAFALFVVFSIILALIWWLIP